MNRIEFLSHKWGNTVDIYNSNELITYIQSLIYEFQQDYPLVVKESLLLNVGELVDVLLELEQRF